MPAAAWLVNTSDLYRDQGVTFDQDWLANFDPTIPNGDCDNEGTIDPDNSEDDWSEDETEIPAGVTDTM